MTSVFGANIQQKSIDSPRFLRVAPTRKREQKPTGGGCVGRWSIEGGSRVDLGGSGVGLLHSSSSLSSTSSLSLSLSSSSGVELGGVAVDLRWILGRCGSVWVNLRWILGRCGSVCVDLAGSGVDRCWACFIASISHQLRRIAGESRRPGFRVF